MPDHGQRVIAKLIDDAGGVLTIAVVDMFRCAQKGTLAIEPVG